MFYNHFTFKLILRLLVINVLALLLFYLIRNTQLWFTITGVALLFVGAILSLYYYIDQIKGDFKRFILAVKTRDHTLNFKNKETKASFPELYESFDDILKTHKDIKMEQEALFHLLKTILEQVPAGVIVKKEDPVKEKSTIAFFNQKAADLLQVPKYTYWNRFESHIPSFTDEIKMISNGGKRFIELKIGEKDTHLSTEVIPIVLHGSNYVIISFQNIKDEIEQKETEAWNRLIGVISHEILNSITPISSLSDTVNTMISDRNSLSAEDLEDLKPAILTIKRRSEGLLDFVKDYRLIAELPTPVLENHTIGEILKHIKILMLPFATGRNIVLKVEQTSSKITLKLDLKLIEQALINLVTNSIYALESTEHPTIEIAYRLEMNKLYLEVTDNGKGIADEDLHKIFVPFYTTRKNGSGIGLTITRNIMKMHQGNLEVISEPGVNTTFSMVFNYI
ncbi:MAG: HAMP domain-containing histidine kinase [Pedobacter sp.]|nr:MAG: HAMP domain-containing histidine kinase [Pedobacter sp.]